MLIGLELVITWLSVRSRLVGDLVMAEPTLLAWRGRLLVAAMRRERVTRDEVLAAARASGIARIEDLHAAVLETDGGLSVIGRSDAPPSDALEGVRGVGPEA